MHRMLRQLADIEVRMRRGPIQVRQVKAAEQELGQALDLKKEELAAAQKEARAKQSQLTDREHKLEDLRGKLNAADSNKEYQLLKDRIAADQQANSVQADEIFETLEKIDVIEAELKQATEALEKAKSETTRIEKKVADEQVVLKNDDASVREELAIARKDLHFELKAPYERSVESLGEDMFASTDTKTCGCCNVTLTQQTASDLLSRKPLICNGCGAILYRKQ